MIKSSLFSTLDIGSNKVVCLIAEADDSGACTIIGIGHQLSEGIHAGIITDIKKAEMSVIAAVNAAEKMAGVSIDSVTVTVSGSTMFSQAVDVTTSIAGQEITDKDLNRMLDLGFQQGHKEGHQIIHCLPGCYTVDDTDQITDPIGMIGENISTTIRVISVSSTLIKNLNHCLAKCHLDVEGYVASPIAAATSCLEEDEKDLGVTMIDIGASQTQIAIFEEGQVLYVGQIPLGGEHVSKDIAKGLSTSIRFAERIKTLYGSVLKTENDSQDVIDVTVADLQGDPDNEHFQESYISKQLLSSIIRPRVEEIFEFVVKDINNAGMLPMIGQRVVITGGGSLLQGMRELVGHMFGKHVRIGKPKYIEGMAESHNNPMFATSLGVLQFEIQQRVAQQSASQKLPQRASNDNQKGGKLMRWFKDNF